MEFPITAPVVNMGVWWHALAFVTHERAKTSHKPGRNVTQAGPKCHTRDKMSQSHVIISHVGLSEWSGTQVIAQSLQDPSTKRSQTRNTSNGNKYMFDYWCFIIIARMGKKKINIKLSVVTGFYTKGRPLVKSNLICPSDKLSWQPGCPILNINIQGNFCISQGNGSSDNLPENLV